MPIPCYLPCPPLHRAQRRCHSPTYCRHDVIIIGGGAAGHLAAISLNQHTRTRTTILESSAKLLQKVRISGGGRCNVTSANDAHDIRAFASHYPRGRKELLTLLASFSPADVRAFFEGLGVRLKVEPGGKVFPQSDDSATVVDALVGCARGLGVRTVRKARVEGVTTRGEEFEVTLADGGVLNAEHVVIATGSAPVAYKWASELGHRVVDPVPSLFTFGIKHPLLEGLAGLSVAEATVSLESRGEGFTQSGPILITHWGLSGPAILSLSAFAARKLHKRRYRMSCVVNWLPSFARDDTTRVLREARRTMSGRHVGTMTPFREIPKRLWRRLVSERGNTNWRELSNHAVEEIVEQLHYTRFQITSKGEFKEEFVTAGGVNLADVNMKTFESKLVKDLYFAGEVLDVDGRTGGYNLEFAWSSGYIAGASIADRIMEARKEEESAVKLV